jgi:hypothetical protein
MGKEKRLKRLIATAYGRALVWKIALASFAQTVVVRTLTDQYGPLAPTSEYLIFICVFVRSSFLGSCEDGC